MGAQGETGDERRIYRHDRTQPASEIHAARGDRRSTSITSAALLKLTSRRDSTVFWLAISLMVQTGFVVASYAAFVTQKLGLMLAHRPGFVAPPLAARKLATLDHFSGGRLAVHIISGGDDADQIKDGDFLTHDERYARTDEYVEILRRIWTADKPVDHEGRYYAFRRSFSDVKPLQEAACADLLWRLFRCCDRYRWQARRRLRSVGENHWGRREDHSASAGMRNALWKARAVQLVRASDPCAYRN